MALIASSWNSPQWLWIALAFPVSLVVAFILRLIWAPVVRVALAPVMRWMGPGFDVLKLQPYVVVGSFIGCLAGWLVFAVFLRR